MPPLANCLTNLHRFFFRQYFYILLRMCACCLFMGILWRIILKNIALAHMHKILAAGNGSEQYDPMQGQFFSRILKLGKQHT